MNTNKSYNIRTLRCVQFYEIQSESLNFEVEYLNEKQLKFKTIRLPQTSYSKP